MANDDATEAGISSRVMHLIRNVYESFFFSMLMLVFPAATGDRLVWWADLVISFCCEKKI